MAATEISIYAVPIATVGAAAIAAVAAYMAGNWKVREVKLTYEQRIRDTYLENARKVAGDVYIPLAIATSDLTKSYREFRIRIDFDLSTAPAGSTNRFKAGCNHFMTLVADLLARGASAYLTLPLEEELADFVSFLDSSLSATSVTRKLTLNPGFYGFSTSVVIIGEGSAAARAGYFARALGAVSSFVLPFTKIRLSVREQITSSPLPSREFERQFQLSAIKISSLIKEVTLGSRNAPVG